MNRKAAFLTGLEPPRNLMLMADRARQTWAEMKQLYPDQWLEIVDYETDKFGEVTRGVIIAHGKSISDFPPPPVNRGPIAIEHTGPCRFKMA